MKDLHLDDGYMDTLATEIEKDTNPVPTVVLTGTAGGREIRVYEGVALGPTDDDPVRRGFFWVATDTDVTTLPSRRVPTGTDMLVIPGRILGHYLAVSSISAEDALNEARRKVAGAC